MNVQANNQARNVVFPAETDTSDFPDAVVIATQGIVGKFPSGERSV